MEKLRVIIYLKISHQTPEAGTIMKINPGQKRSPERKCLSSKDVYKAHK